MKAPIETKVIAAAGGAGLGGAFGTFILWLLGVTFWHSSAAADKATEAVSSVPQPVAALIVIVVALVGSAIAGYVAPHTSRPDLHILGKAFVESPALDASAGTIKPEALASGSVDVTGTLTSGPVEAAPEAPAPSA